MLNRVPHSVTGFVPNQIINDFSRSIDFLRVTGCKGYVKSDMADKIVPQGEIRYLIGYGNVQKGYKMWNPDTGDVLIFRQPKFEENLLQGDDNNAVVEEPGLFEKEQHSSTAFACVDMGFMIACKIRETNDHEKCMFAIEMEMNSLCE
jgi:hypothetical protein